MRLTTYTDYSLRVLIYLGLERDRLATIAEVSDIYRISSNHLMKVIHNLGKLGYIQTVRGRSGGIRLAVEPREINLGALVRKVESDFAIVECMAPSHREECLIVQACRLKVVLDEALEAFLGVLDEYTLADLLRNAKKLRTLLEIDSQAGAAAH